MRIWNYKEKRLEAVLPGHEKGVIKILITSDYKYVVSKDSAWKIRIWNLRDKSHEGLFTDAESAREWILKYSEIESFFQ